MIAIRTSGQKTPKVSPIGTLAASKPNASMSIGSDRTLNRINTASQERMKAPP